MRRGMIDTLGVVTALQSWEVGDGVPLPKTSPCGKQGGECVWGKRGTSEDWSSVVENLPAIIKRIPHSQMGLLQRGNTVFGLCFRFLSKTCYRDKEANHEIKAQHLRGNCLSKWEDLPCPICFPSESVSCVLRFQKENSSLYGMPLQVGCLFSSLHDLAKWRSCTCRRCFLRMGAQAQSTEEQARKGLPMAIRFGFPRGNYFLHHLSQLTSTSTLGPNWMWTLSKGIGLTGGVCSSIATAFWWGTAPDVAGRLVGRRPRARSLTYCLHHDQPWKQSQRIRGAAERLLGTFTFDFHLADIRRL